MPGGGGSDPRDDLTTHQLPTTDPAHIAARAPHGRLTTRMMSGITAALRGRRGQAAVGCVDAPEAAGTYLTGLRPMPEQRLMPRSDRPWTKQYGVARFAVEGQRLVITHWRAAVKYPGPTDVLRSRILSAIRYVRSPGPFPTTKWSRCIRRERWRSRGLEFKSQTMSGTQ